VLHGPGATRAGWYSGKMVEARVPPRSYTTVPAHHRPHVPLRLRTSAPAHHGHHARVPLRSRTTALAYYRAREPSRSRTFAPEYHTQCKGQGKASRTYRRASLDGPVYAWLWHRCSAVANETYHRNLGRPGLIPQPRVEAKSHMM